MDRGGEVKPKVEGGACQHLPLFCTINILGHAHGGQRHDSRQPAWLHRWQILPEQHSGLL